MKDGLLLVDKPSGCTSHDVVQRARGILGQKKIGHCGTLDPTATGLLVLTVGKATRLTRFLIRAPKVYIGSIQFGQETNTYDAAGEVLAEGPVDSLTTGIVKGAMEPFIGRYEHLTPPFSARKVKGVKSYELARRGEEVPVNRKEVTVYEYCATSDLSAEGAIDFRLACSSGTYARSLAHELGLALGSRAHLASLRRLKVGGFALTNAATLEELEAAEELEALEAWIPFDAIPLPFEEVEVDAKQERRILHGQTALVRDLASGEGDWIKINTRHQQFIAVASIVEQIGTGVGVLQPRIVFK
ncbi:MAG: tRNA pseudouridine(55) synthase TruB [Deltaproteobacteria bacterium]|nr:tRNA pseudouridine(55) synthase TruB [Deltaproteobacteria bacterium]